MNYKNNFGLSLAMWTCNQHLKQRAALVVKYFHIEKGLSPTGALSGRN